MLLTLGTHLSSEKTWVSRFGRGSLPLRHSGSSKHHNWSSQFILCRRREQNKVLLQVERASLVAQRLKRLPVETERQAFYLCCWYWYYRPNPWAERLAMLKKILLITEKKLNLFSPFLISHWRICRKPNGYIYIITSLGSKPFLFSCYLQCLLASR